MINYNDLHKIYNNDFDPPEVNTSAPKAVQKAVQTHTVIKDPTQDLVRTTVSFGIGVLFARFLGLGVKRPMYSSDANQSYSDVKNPPPGSINWRG